MKNNDVSAPVAIFIVVGGALMMFAASHTFETSPAQMVYSQLFN